MAGDEARKQFIRQLGTIPDFETIRLLLESGNPNVTARTEIPHADTVEYPLEYYLRSAIEARQEINLDIVRLLLEKGAPPNGRDGANVSPLGLAGRTRDKSVELTRILLDAGADPNKLTEGGMSPLYSFINSHADTDAIQLLIERGAGVNSVYARDDETRTPLGMAIRNKMPDVVSLLLQRGANPNQPVNTDGDLPIHYATRLADLTAINQLIAGGADPNGRTPTGWTAIHIATTPDVIVALRTAGADINAKNARGHTALTLALGARVSKINEARITALLANGADPNIPGRDDETPLEIALMNRRPRMMVQLLAAGANPNIMYEGMPLIFEVMEVLNIELANDNSISPFIRVIETMIERGVDPNVRGGDGETLLHRVASIAGSEDGKKLITALRGRGAEPNTVDGEGMTLLEMAVYSGYPGKDLAYMIPLGFDPNFIGPAGTALLHRLVAREIDQYWTAEKLAIRVRKAVQIPTINVNLRTATGETALHLAARRNLYEIIQVLLDADADPKLRVGDDGALPADLATDARVKALLSGTDYAGKTLADIQLLERIFNDPQNISVCPICLSFSERSDGCRYLMGHTCKPEERDEELYQMFKSKTPGIQAPNTIEWCTECGRVTNHHKHYSLSRADAGLPGFAPVDPTRQPALAGGVVHFVDDCRPSGGGGLEEKFVRFHVLIDTYAKLQANVGKMSESRARVATIRDVWNSPLTIPEAIKAPYVELATLMRAPPAAGASEEEVAEWNGRVASLKTFGINFEVFGEDKPPTGPVAEEAPAPDFPRPEADKDLNPIRHDGGGAGPAAAGAGGGGDPCILVGGPHEDDRPVFQFQHRQPDGSVYVHPREEWICAPDLAQMIWKRTIDGKCPINPRNCKGLLYPEELVGIFPEELNRDLEELADARIDPATAMATYRRLFNKARQATTGGKRRKTYRKKKGGAPTRKRSETPKRPPGGSPARVTPGTTSPARGLPTQNVVAPTISLPENLIDEVIANPEGPNMMTGPEIVKRLSRKIDDDEAMCLIPPLAL